MNVTHNEGANRFEIETAAGIAVLEYMRDGDKVVMTHTAVPEAAEGRGVGSELARTALAWAREQGLRVHPVCPFVHGYVRKHAAEYRDLVGAV
ncbi:MAG TPA: GNAT family N-acetyltransferase [Gemmatimonadaceae bacterium]|nr:GNAT family N-acetyltransferase [Gemmatimonadaceae bacterium]